MSKGGSVFLSVKRMEVDPRDSNNVEFRTHATPEETEALLDFYHTALTVSEDELWVNLSPYESNRTIPEAIATTRMGEEMLNADCLLKRLSASLIHPETAPGSDYWSEIIGRVKREFGTTDLTIHTFRKVTMQPKKFLIYEHNYGDDPGIDKFIRWPDGRSVFVQESVWEATCQRDAAAFDANAPSIVAASQLTRSDLLMIDDLCTDCFRQLILPKIEEEINTGRNFAVFRQIGHSTILARWYKDNFPEQTSVIDAGPSNVPIHIEFPDEAGGGELRTTFEREDVRAKYYEEYMRIFRDGVFRHVGRRFDSGSSEVLSRTFISGGVSLGLIRSQRGQIYLSVSLGD